MLSEVPALGFLPRAPLSTQSPGTSRAGTSAPSHLPRQAAAVLLLLQGMRLD